MDVSNPILDPSRCKVGALSERRKLRIRQDFSLLSAKSVGVERVTLPTPYGAEGEQDYEHHLSCSSRLFELLREKKVPQETGVDLSSLECLRKVSKGCPVSGFSVNGIRVHPVGVQSENVDGLSCVSPLRVFGGGQRPGFCTQQFVEHFGLDPCIDAGTKYIYSYGTSKGFKKRVVKQMGMPSRSILEGYGNKVNFNYIYKKLDELFDSKDLNLPKDRWEGPLFEILEQVTVAGDASAGYPYCKDKAFAWDEMTRDNSILSVLVDALKDPDYSVVGGTRQSLLADNPEWFLCELKNKLDRYEVDKLDEKCRPYMCMPFHWTILQSNLCQVFCDALPHVGNSQSNTHSAYKFSAVDDGIGVIHRRMQKLKKGHYDFYCYGDDTDLYWRDNAGTLWRVSPDFRQMDGSVDKDCVNATVSWIYKKFAEEHGSSVFWHNVCKEWIQMAVDPSFVCSGPNVYRKKNATGIMSGVVGTTLFDTVKSVLSYDMFIQALTTGVFSKKNLHDESKVAKFFLDKFGLVVKPGTWVPHKVNEIPVEGELYSPTKFLGVLWKWVMHVDADGDRMFMLAPSLKQADFLALALTPRYDLEQAKKRDQRMRKQTKGTAPPTRDRATDQRYIFDWARGLMITCAFSSDVQTSFLHSVVNTIGPEPILMDVQAGGGLGAPPETPMLAEVWGEGDLRYCDSQGFPSSSWCRNLYAPKERGLLDAEWICLYPSLSNWMTVVKKARKTDPCFAVGVSGALKNFESVLLLGEQIVPSIKSVPSQTQAVMECEIVMEQPTHYTMKVSAAGMGEKRGPKQNVVGGKVIGVNKDSNFPQVLCAVFKEVADSLNSDPFQTAEEVFGSRPPEGLVDGEPVYHTFRKKKWIENKKVMALPLFFISQRTGWSERQIEQAALEGKFLVQEHGKTKWITVVPIVTGTPSVQLEQHFEKAQEVVLANVIPTSRDKLQRMSGAKGVLKKQDTQSGCVSKLVPEIVVDWLPADLPVEVFCNWVRQEIRENPPKVMEPDRMWSALNSFTYSAVAEGESLRAPCDLDEFNDDATHFRAHFKVETSGVDQKTLVNNYELVVQFIDYNTGKAGEPLVVGEHIDPVPIARCKGPSKATCAAALKNFFLKWVWPEYKGELFVAAANPRKVTFQRERGTRLVQTLFSFADAKPPGESWGEQDNMIQLKQAIAKCGFNKPMSQLSPEQRKQVRACMKSCNSSGNSQKGKKTLKKKSHVSNNSIDDVPVARAQALRHKQQDSLVMSGTDRIMFIEDMSEYKARTIVSMVPIMPSLFPRLERVATTFHRIRYLSLVFEVQPQMGSSTTGGYILSFLKDATEVVPNGEPGLRKLSDQNGAISGVDWQPRSMPVNNMPDLYYTEWNDDEPRWSSPGKLVLATDGQANVKGSLVIYCKWKVRLMESDLEVKQESTSITLQDSIGMKAGSKNIGVGASFEDHKPVVFRAAIPGARKGDKFKLPTRVYYLINESNEVKGMSSFIYFYWSENDYLLPLKDDMITEITHLSYGDVEVLSKGSSVDKVYNKTENLVRGSKCICVQTNSGPFSKLLKQVQEPSSGHKSSSEDLSKPLEGLNMTQDYLESFLKESWSNLKRNLTKSMLPMGLESQLKEVLKESLRVLVPLSWSSPATSILFSENSSSFERDFRSWATDLADNNFSGSLVFEFEHFVDFVMKSMHGRESILLASERLPLQVRMTWLSVSAESIEVL